LIDTKEYGEVQMRWQAHTLHLGLLVEIGLVCLSNIAVLKIAVSVSSSFLFVSCSVLVGIFQSGSFADIPVVWNEMVLQI
jgi:hypothetical protein